ncbi:hypothetical protein [Frondihabitans sucicola]|uniref:hypothetical protein n=1 Tax=Frondihabitans sucicola TaxID=1268041 RepID=UPI002572DAE8|nr:hypothetical protein [Frondihabitans sucicola]
MAAPGTLAVSSGSGTAQAAATVTGQRADLRVTGDQKVRVAFPASAHSTGEHAGVSADRWRTTAEVPTADRPSTVTVDDLVSLFARIPVGISPDTQPGPYAARWSTTATTTLWSVGGGILDTKRTERTVLTISGGGLTTSRSYSVDAASGSGDSTWSVPSARVDSIALDVRAAKTTTSELRVWNAWLPIALGIAALWQAALLVRDRRRASLESQPSESPTPTPDDSVSDQGDTTRSSSYAVR